VLSGGVDPIVKVWDLRNFNSHLDYTNREMLGHDYAIRKTRWSPYEKNLLTTVSYDLTVKMWRFDTPALIPTNIYRQNTEFNFGLDFSNSEREFAVASWDKSITLYAY